MVRAVCLVLLLWLGAASAQETARQTVPQDQAQIRLTFAPVARAASPSVVNIYARRIVATRQSPFAGDPFFERFFGPTRTPQVQNALGSGVIVDEGGIIVSNHHVVGNAQDIRVVLSDRTEFDAEVLLSDEARDIAILQIAPERPLPALDFADSDRAEVGDLVLAIGNPFGVGQTVTSGIVSGLARSAQPGDPADSYFIQTDAAINPGNSGGALVDMDGRLLGINTAILTRSGGSNGIGFAIPANLVRAYVTRAMAGDSAEGWPWAGVGGQPVDGSVAAALGLPRPEGLILTELHPESPFAEAGLAPGDVILRLGPVVVDGIGALDHHYRTRPPGSEVEATYLRDGAERTVAVPVRPPAEVPERAPLRLASGGFLAESVIETVNPGVIAEFDLPLSAAGVVLREVGPYARRVGLRPGDILVQIAGQPIASTDDVTRAVALPGRGDIVFDRDGRRRILRFRG